MAVSRLPTEYWHVRFNQNQFVQWPYGCWPSASDTFGFSAEDQEEAARRAGIAAMREKENPE